MAEGLALVLGRRLDRPGWGAVRRRVGGFLAEVRADAPDPARLRLETPNGVHLAAVEYVEGETVFECALRTHPRMLGIMLCGADLTPLDPADPIGDAKILVVIVRRKSWSTVDFVENNQLGELRWSIARGCGWHPRTSRFAAAHGHLELLQWAIAHGCPWDAETSCYAAYGGHLELLQWAVAHGCVWKNITSWGAAEGGHLELLQWAVANGCTIAPGTESIASKKGYTEMVAWLDARP